MEAPKQEFNGDDDQLSRHVSDWYLKQNTLGIFMFVLAVAALGTDEWKHFVAALGLVLSIWIQWFLKDLPFGVLQRRLRKAKAELNQQRIRQIDRQYQPMWRLVFNAFPLFLGVVSLLLLALWPLLFGWRLWFPFL